MINRLAECRKLHELEDAISLELDGKQFWGDIELSLEEYEYLCSRIRTAINEDCYGIYYLLKWFPVSLTTLLVFFARYKYDTNFWGALETEIGTSVSISLASELGTMARKTFAQMGFDFSDVEGERRVNLEPVLFEAGLPPESSLNDLFYVLHYDSHRVFDPQLVIDELIDARSYQIRKPMLKFLKRFKERRAEEFVSEVHEAMICVDQGRTSDSYYVGNYIEWKKKESTKESSRARKKQELQTRPYLFFDIGRNGLCILLPRILLEDEWVDRVSWSIVTDVKTVRKEMVVHGENGRFVDSIAVPVSPSEKYHVELVNEEDFINESTIQMWDVVGISPTDYAFFNSQGRLIGTRNQYLPYPSGILVYGITNKVTSQNASLTGLAYPTQRSEYRICSVEITGNSGSITISDNVRTVTWETRPQLSLSLSGTTLFGLPCTEEYRFFVSPPTVIVEKNDGMSCEDLCLRVGNQSIDIGSLFYEGIARVNLQDYPDISFEASGTYSVRLYDENRFLKQIEFTLLPRIETDYSSHVSWDSALNMVTKRKFRFSRISNVQMDFKKCFVSNTEEEYIVEPQNDCGFIEVSLCVTTDEAAFSVELELPVSPVDCRLIDGDGDCRSIQFGRPMRLTREDIDGKEPWLSLRFLGAYTLDHYCVFLKSVDGIVQREQVNQTQRGCFNVNLSVFSDTIRSCPLPVTIELCHDDCDSEAIPLVAVMDYVPLGNQSKYWANKTEYGIISIPAEVGECDITISSFRNSSLKQHLRYENSLVSKSGVWRGYRCDARLDEGLYRIEANREAIAFEFEEEDEVALTHDGETLYYSSRNSGAPINSFSDWIDQVVKDILFVGTTKDLSESDSYRIASEISKFKTDSLSAFDYERIIALTYFARSVCCEAKKKNIATVISCISAYILESKDRIEIIKMLTALHCSQDVFAECVRAFKLVLFKPGVEDALSLADRVENYSLEIALLLRMGADDSLRNTICRERFREIIGKEAILSFLSVPGESDEIAIREQQLSFLKEQKSKVRIQLTRDISGEMEPITNMIKCTYNKVIFNKEDKPDVGVYFDRIRYVDQYLNWYFSNIDSSGNIKSDTSKRIRFVISKYMKDILDAFKFFKVFKEVADIAQKYEEALKARKIGDIYTNLNAVVLWRYFYVQGIAAFITQLPKDCQRCGAEIRPAEAFMTEALQIAPRISQRDVLMANTFLYLCRKEKTICQ